eukprot:7760401-Heterocapsa_arctica.AAC.1
MDKSRPNTYCSGSLLLVCSESAHCFSRIECRGSVGCVRQAVQHYCLRNQLRHLRCQSRLSGRITSHSAIV